MFTTSSTDSQVTNRPKGGKSAYKHIPHREKPPHLVAKRNARERRRVQAVNSAFARLRKCVPIENRNKRLSKVKTLQKAIEYIEELRHVLNDGSFSGLDGFSDSVFTVHSDMGDSSFEEDESTSGGFRPPSVSKTPSSQYFSPVGNFGSESTAVESDRSFSTSIHSSSFSSSDESPKAQNIPTMSMSTMFSSNNNHLIPPLDMYSHSPGHFQGHQHQVTTAHVSSSSSSMIPVNNAHNNLHQATFPVSWYHSDPVAIYGQSTNSSWPSHSGHLLPPIGSHGLTSNQATTWTTTISDKQSQ